MCDVRFGGAEQASLIIASITHLEFDRRFKVAREIATYQKHRTKRLQKMDALAAALAAV